MGFINALRDYARLEDPAGQLFSEEILVYLSDQTLCIFDKFPKAVYHYLILPRTQAFNGVAMNTIHELFEQPKASIMNVLLALKRDSEQVISISKCSHCANPEQPSVQLKSMK